MRENDFVDSSSSKQGSGEHRADSKRTSAPTEAAGEFDARAVADDLVRWWGLKWLEKKNSTAPRDKSAINFGLPADAGDDLEICIIKALKRAYAAGRASMKEQIMDKVMAAAVKGYDEGRAARGAQAKPFCFYNREEDAIFMDGEKFVRAAQPADSVNKTISGSTRAAKDGEAT